MPVGKSLKVYCSDRGTHPERLLGRVNDTRGLRRPSRELSAKEEADWKAMHDHMQWWHEVTSTTRLVATPVERLTTKRGTVSWRVTCNTCRHEYRVAELTLARLVAAGLDRVDLSMLPTTR